MSLNNCKWQVFTPQSIVEHMLDEIGYSHELFGKKILENSCGNGSFLTIVVERYIRDCIFEGRSIDEIRMGLSQDIYGMEIDEQHYRDCIKVRPYGDDGPLFDWLPTSQSMIDTAVNFREIKEVLADLKEIEEKYLSD